MEEMKAMFDIEKKTTSWIEDHQHDLGGGEADSQRQRKMEASSQGPMSQKEWQRMLGEFFFLSFCFSFSHLLVIAYSFFTLRYFVYYAPLLCAVCKFRYSLLPRPYFIASFYRAISVTTFVEVGSFFGGPDHQPCLPQHLVSSFVFIVFSFISFCSRLKVVFCIVIIIFSLFVGIYFSLWFGNSKTFADCERVVFGIGPCPFISPNWPLPVHFVWNIGPCPFNE